MSPNKAHILHRTWAGMDRTQHVDQHDLAIQTRKMIAKEGLHDTFLISLEPPLKLPVQRPARAAPDPSLPPSSPRASTII